MSKPTRKTLPMGIKLEVWEKYFPNMIRGKCVLCQNAIMIVNAGWEAGHIISVANDGKDCVSNLIPLCIGCNRSMNKTNADEFALTYYPNSVFARSLENNVDVTNKFVQLCTLEDDDLSFTEEVIIQYETYPVLIRNEREVSMLLRNIENNIIYKSLSQVNIRKYPEERYKLCLMLYRYININFSDQEYNIDFIRYILDDSSEINIEGALSKLRFDYTRDLSFIVNNMFPILLKMCNNKLYWVFTFLLRRQQNYAYDQDLINQAITICYDELLNYPNLCDKSEFLKIDSHQGKFRRNPTLDEIEIIYSKRMFDFKFKNRHITGNISMIDVLFGFDEAKMLLNKNVPHDRVVQSVLNQVVRNKLSTYQDNINTFILMSLPLVQNPEHVAHECLKIGFDKIIQKLESYLSFEELLFSHGILSTDPDKIAEYIHIDSKNKTLELISRIVYDFDIKVIPWRHVDLSALFVVLELTNSSWSYQPKYITMFYEFCTKFSGLIRSNFKLLFIILCIIMLDDGHEFRNIARWINIIRYDATFRQHIPDINQFFTQYVSEDYINIFNAIII